MYLILCDSQNSCCRSVTTLCPTLCNSMDYSMPGFPVLHYLLEFVQTHVRWVSDAIQPSHLLLSPSPPVLSLFNHQSFPASGSFPVSRLFASRGQNIGASASVLAMSIQDLFPFGLTGLITLLSKGLSKVSSAPQFKSINSSALSLLCGPTFNILHYYSIFVTST